MESFVSEMFRYGCFFSVLFERQANEDTQVDGYFIPKVREGLPVIYYSEGRDKSY